MGDDLPVRQVVVDALPITPPGGDGNRRPGLCHLSAACVLAWCWLKC